MALLDYARLRPSAALTSEGKTGRGLSMEVLFSAGEAVFEAGRDNKGTWLEG